MHKGCKLWTSTPTLPCHLLSELFQVWQHKNKMILLFNIEEIHLPPKKKKRKKTSLCARHYWFILPVMISVITLRKKKSKWSVQVLNVLEVVDDTNPIGKFLCVDKLPSAIRKFVNFVYRILNLSLMNKQIKMFYHFYSLSTNIFAYILYSWCHLLFMKSNLHVITALI